MPGASLRRGGQNDKQLAIIQPPMNAEKQNHSSAFICIYRRQFAFFSSLLRARS
jgi:hypothetical protein